MHFVWKCLEIVVLCHVTCNMQDWRKTFKPFDVLFNLIDDIYFFIATPHHYFSTCMLSFSFPLLLFLRTIVCFSSELILVPAFIGVHYEFYVEYFNSVLLYITFTLSCICIRFFLLFTFTLSCICIRFFFVALYFVVVTLSVTGTAVAIAVRWYWVVCVCVYVFVYLCGLCG